MIFDTNTLDALISHGKMLVIDYSYYFKKPFLENGRSFRSLVHRKKFVFDGEKFV